MNNPVSYEDALFSIVFNREIEHQKIHEGISFTASYSLTTANSNNVRTAILITVGALECHLVASYSCTTSANAGIYESPTIAANTGTHTNDIINRNRIRLTPSKILSNATVPVANKFTTLTEAEIAGDGTFALGAKLRLEPLKTSSGVNALGGTVRGTTEWILKPTLKYLFILQNTVASINDHLIILDWYEET
jgi:hypothetical protein